MLNVTIKLIMLSVIMLRVVMLNVVAPSNTCALADKGMVIQCTLFVDQMSDDQMTFGQMTWSRQGRRTV